MWQSRGIAIDLCIDRLVRSENVNNMKIPAFVMLKAGEFGKAYWAAILVARFAFSCTLVANLRH